MGDWPILPGKSTIRSAAEASLAPLGFKRRGSWTFQREITRDLLAQVTLNGNEVSQQVFVSVVSLQTNKIALEVWSEVGRVEFFGRKELSAGVPIRETWVRGGWVDDPKAGRPQKHWHFFSMPEWGYPTVTLDDFCRDLQLHSEQLVRETPDLKAALSNPRFGIPRYHYLEATAHALLGDRHAFELTVAEAFNYLEQLQKYAEEREREFQRTGESFIRVGGPSLDYEKYFNEIRSRYFGVSR